MKYSIVVPVYNEEKVLGRFLKGIEEIDYDRKEFEVVIVNDGSRDKSQLILERFDEVVKKKKNGLNVRIFHNENQGRSLAREFGGKKAKCEKLLFIDAKCVIDKGVLNKCDLHEKDECVVGSVKILEGKSFTSRLFYLFHKRFYREFEGDFGMVVIDKDNFDVVPKGTGIMFVRKSIFLSSQIENKQSKYSSDDTKLLWNILGNCKGKSILKSSEIFCYYFPREDFGEEFVHTFNRGPKFVDYYFKFGKRFFWYFWALILGSLFVLFSLIFYWKVLFLYVLLCFFFDVWVGFVLAENLKDFFVFLWFVPIFVGAFILGIFKGFFVKLG